MRVYFNAKQAALPPRSLLLLQSFKDHFGPRSDNSEACVLKDDTAVSRLEVFLGLSGLNTGTTSDTAVFFGLCCAPKQMLGRNFLICLRPLAEELADFEARFAQVAEARPQWCSDILSNFERCIFVNEADLRASVGFSPWVELGLAANVPVRLPRPRLSLEGGGLDVAIFLHDPDQMQAAQAVHDALPRMVRAHLVQPDDSTQFVHRHAASTVHIHCGYDGVQDTPLITPFDSVVSGIYTIMQGEPGGLSKELHQLFDLRSYARCISAPEDIAKSCRQTYEKLLGLQESGVRFNPEIKRFETTNQQFFETCIQHLEEQLT